MAINSKKKGARNERKVVKLIADWTGREFARVPASGGLRWKSRSDTVGDITCQEERHFFPFSVEVKSRNEINFEHLLYLDNAEIKKFWGQALEDSGRAKKIPLLFMRYDGMPKELWFIILNYQDFRKFRKYLNTSANYVTINRDMVIMNSAVFLDSNYKKVRRIAIKTIDEKWPRK